MSQDDPISEWIAQLQEADDDDAAAGLWRHFVQRLSDAARHRLSPATRRVYDEDDAAVSAFNSVLMGIAAGRFPKLNDRESLWRLLLVITSRKITHRHRYDHQQKRDLRKTTYDSVFADGPDAMPQDGVQQIPCRDPSPEFAAAFAETCESLFASLPDPRLQEVAALRMEGYSDAEIAARMKSARSTVQRRLEMIRRCWQHMEAPND